MPYYILKMKIKKDDLDSYSKGFHKQGKVNALWDGGEQEY